MANGLLELVRRLSVVEKDVRRISTWEHSIGGGGGGGGDMIVHALDPADGPWHYGSLRWDTVSKAGSDLADLQVRRYIDLTDRTHNIVGSDHSIAAGKWSLVGAANDNALGTLLARSVVSSAPLESVLKSDSAGGLELVSLIATASVRTPLLYSAGGLQITSTGALNDITLTPGRHMVLTENRRFISDGAILSGYTGHGFGVWTEPVYDPVTGLIAGYRAQMETDNITVRGRMNVYELVIRQIRSTNGNLLVTSASKIKTVTLLTGTWGVNNSTYTITVEDETYHGFFPGDLVKAQRWKWDGNLNTPSKATIYIVEMTVLTTPTLTTYTARLDDGGAVPPAAGDYPQAGFDMVRHGSRTEADRQGMVAIMADETNSPFIAILNGVNDWGSWYAGDKIKGMVGNLNSLPIASIPDATGFEYGMAFGTGWTNDDTNVKISNRVALFNNITAHWYNVTPDPSVETVRIEPVGNLIMGKDISQPALTAFTFTSSTGILKLGRSDTPAITFNGTTGASYFSGIMTIATSGEIRQGVASAGNVQSDAFASLTGYTGFRMWAANAFSGEVGTLAGYNTGTPQWTAAVDGRILVGNITNIGTSTATADAILSSRGITLKSVTGTSSAADTVAGTSKGIRWYDNPVTDANPRASILSGATSGGFPFMTLNLRDGSGGVSAIGLYQSGGVMQAWFDNIDAVVGIPGFFAAYSGGLPTVSIGDGASSDFTIQPNTDTFISTHWLPEPSATYDIGSPGKKWRGLYVETLHADYIDSGVIIGGAIWQNDDADMQILSESASPRTLFIANPHASGVMHLNVEGNIIVGGTVDGVDIASLNATVLASSFTAGDGLTGGGSIGSALTFNVGAGTLINVQTDTVGIAAAPNTYHFIGSGGDTVAEWVSLNTLAGNGLSQALGVLHIGAGTLMNIPVGGTTVGIANAAGAYYFIGSDNDSVAGWVAMSSLAGDGLSLALGTLSVGAGTLISVPVGGTTVNVANAPGAYSFIGSGAGTTPAWLNLSSMKGNGLTYLNGVLTLGTPTPSVSVTSTNVVSASSHTHAIDWSSNTGAASKILGTNASGVVQVQQVIANTAVNTNQIYTLGFSNLLLTPDIGYTIEAEAPLNVTGHLTATSADITADIMAGTATVTGHLTAASAAITANITAGSVTTTTITSPGYLSVTAVNDITFVPGPAGRVIVTDGKALQSQTFTSALLGGGFRLDYGVTTAGRSTLEVDNIYVRGQLNVYEFVVRQIRATNGNLFVSTAFVANTVTYTGGSADGSPGATYRITPATGTLVVGMTGDLLRAQRWLGGTSIMQSDIQITGVAGDASYMDVTLIAGSAPANGFEYARLGNASNVDRQGGLYLASDDSGSPFMDVWNGVTSHAGFGAAGTVKVRVGKITGITSTANEYGLIAGLNGFAATNSFIRVSNLGVQMNNIPIAMYNGSANTGLWEANGSISASNVSVSTVNNRAFFVDTTTGNVRVGKIGPTLNNMIFTASSGVLTINNNATPMVTISAAGAITVGPVLAERSRIVIDSGVGEGIRMVWRTAANMDSDRILISNDGNLYLYSGNFDVGQGFITWGSPNVGRIDSNGIRIESNLGSGGTQLRSYAMVDSADNLIGYYSGYQNGSTNALSIRAYQKPSTSGGAHIELYTPNGNIVLSPTGGFVQVESGYVNVVGYVNTLSGFFVSNSGSAANPVFGLQSGGAGMYFSGSSNVRFSTGSALRADISSTGITSYVNGTPGNASIGFSNGAGIYLSTSVGSRATLTSATDWVMIMDGTRAHFQVGSAPSPSVTFEGNSLTGMYSGGANAIAWSTGGSEAMRLDSANQLRVVGGGFRDRTASYAVSTGWRRVARFSYRGNARIIVGNSGGSYQPFVITIEAWVSWTTGLGALYVWDVNNTPVTAVRITTVSSTEHYIECNFSSALDSLFIQQELGGWASSVTLIGTSTLGGGTEVVSTPIAGGFSMASTDTQTNYLSGTVFAGDTVFSGNVDMSSGSLLRAASGSWGTGLRFTAGNFGIISTANYMILENGGTALLTFGLDARDSVLNLGIGNTNSRASIVNLYSDGAAPTTISSQLNRIAGTNGELRIYNRGTGLLTFYTNGTLSAQIASNGSNAAFQMSDGTSSVPAFSFMSQPGLGIYRNATNSMQFVSTSILMATLAISSNRATFAVNTVDAGNGAAGPGLIAGYNGNATNAGAGFLGLTNRGGVQYRFWVSNANVFRFHTADPTTANDNAGTAIITYASSLSVKDLLDEPVTGGSLALGWIRNGAAAVRPFQYKRESPTHDRPYGETYFSGIITDYEPRYGMDHGKALNVINAIGDLMIGTNHLHDRIIALEAEVASLKAQLVH